MSDLTITVTAPGATSAATEIKGARTETTKAAEALAKLKKANDDAAKSSHGFEDAIQAESRRLQEVEMRTRALTEARKRLAARSQLFGDRGAGAPALALDWKGVRRSTSLEALRSDNLTTQAALASRKAASIAANRATLTAIQTANSPTAMGLVTGTGLTSQAAILAQNQERGRQGGSSGTTRNSSMFARTAGNLGRGINGALGSVGERFGFLATLGPAAVAAGAGLAVLAAGFKIGMSALTMHKDALERSARAAMEWTKIQIEATKTRQQQGLDAANSQGPSLLALIARGGNLKELANAATGRGANAVDAQNAVLALSNRRASTPLETDISSAEGLARITGTSLTEAAKSLAEFSERGVTAMAAIVSEKEQRRVSEGEVIGRLVAMGLDPLAQAITKIQQNAGQVGLIGQGQIGTQGLVGSNSALFAAQDPEAAAKLAVFTEMSGKLEYLKSIHEGMGRFETLMDRLVNGRTSAQGGYAGALSDSGAFGAAVGAGN